MAIGNALNSSIATLSCSTSITIAGGTAITAWVDGTFTPTIAGDTGAGTPTYQRQIGRYRRINNQVWIQISLAWNATTGMTGNMQVAGLPFTSENTTGLLCYFISAQGTDSQLLPLGSGFWPMFHVNPNNTVLPLSYLETTGDQIGYSVRVGSVAISGQYFI